MSTDPRPVDMSQVPPVPWAWVGDPAIVLEIHEWKWKFIGRVREYQGAKGGGA
jgi:hypothetical protein